MILSINPIFYYPHVTLFFRHTYRYNMNKKLTTLYRVVKKCCFAIHISYTNKCKQIMLNIVNIIFSFHHHVKCVLEYMVCTGFNPLFFFVRYITYFRDKHNICIENQCQVKCERYIYFQIKVTIHFILYKEIFGNLFKFFFSHGWTFYSLLG